MFVMSIALKVLIVIGYIIFGSIWFLTSGRIVGYNSVMDVFSFEKTKSNELFFLDHSNDTSKFIVKYNFKVKSKSYSNKLTVDKNAFFNKAGKSQVYTIHYNSIFPTFNYIQNWKLDTYYRFTFVLSTIFFLLIIFCHLKLRKDDKWEKRYKRAFNWPD